MSGELKKEACVCVCVYRDLEKVQKIVAFQTVPDLGLSNTSSLATDWQAYSSRNVYSTMRPIESDVTEWHLWFKYGTVL